MTDGVEYLVEDVDLDTVEALLAVDGRIVTIETGRVEEFLFTAPTIVPDDRQIIVTDSDDGICQRMNG